MKTAENKPHSIIEIIIVECITFIILIVFMLLLNHLFLQHSKSSVIIGAFIAFGINLLLDFKLSIKIRRYTQSKSEKTGVNITDEELQNMIRACLQESTEGFIKWMENETEVVDKDTKRIIPNCEISLKSNPKSILLDYIYPRLEKHGITLRDKEK